MEEHRCLGDGNNLLFLTESKLVWENTVCGEVPPYIAFYLCRVCRSIMFYDNMGYEVNSFNDKLRKMRPYKGTLSTGELSSVVPNLEYNAAKQLVTES